MKALQETTMTSEKTAVVETFTPQETAVVETVTPDETAVVETPADVNAPPTTPGKIMQ